MKQGLKHSTESSKVENLVKDGVKRFTLFVVVGVFFIDLALLLASVIIV